MFWQGISLLIKCLPFTTGVWKTLDFSPTKHFVLTIRFRNFCRETVLLPIAFSIVYCSCMLALSPVCVCWLSKHSGDRGK